MRLAAPGMANVRDVRVMKAFRVLSRTKLYWGLADHLPDRRAWPRRIPSSGRNIFLSYGNLTDVLRQVSITGLVATGMTIVILLGGIDLSVGSVMGFSTIICAMLLTQSGWTAASMMGVPARDAAVSFIAVAFLARFVFSGLARGRDVDAGRRREIALGPWRGVRIPALLGLVAAVAVAWFTISQVPTKFGVLGVLLVTPCVALLLGSINGAPDRRGTAAAVHRHAGDDGQRARHRPAHRRSGQRGRRGLHRHQRDRRLRNSALDAVGHRADAERVLPGGDHPVRRDPAFHRLWPLRLRHRRQHRGGQAVRHQGRTGSVHRLSALRAAGGSRRRAASSRNTARANPTPAPASNSTRSPRW